MVDFEKDFSPTQRNRLEEVINNDTERAKFIEKAKDKNKAIQLIEDYKEYRGTDINRLDARAILPAVDALGLGFGQELISGVIAGARSLKGDTNFGEEYRRILDATEKAEKQYSDKYGGIALASELIGGIPTGGTAIKIANKLTGGAGQTGAKRLGRSILEGAGIGGIYGAGRESDDRFEGAKMGAIGGAVLNPVGEKVIGGLSKVLPTERIGRTIDRIRGVNPLEEKPVRQALQNIVESQGGKDAIIETIDDVPKFKNDIPLMGKPTVVEQVRPELTKDFGSWNEFKSTLKTQRDNKLNDSVDNIFVNLLDDQPITRQDGELYIDYIARISKSNSNVASKKYSDLALENKITAKDGFADELLDFLDNDIYGELSKSTKSRIQAITSSGNNKRTVFKVDADGIKIKDGFTIDDIDEATVDKLYRALRDSRNSSLKAVDTVGKVDAEFIQSRNLVGQIDDLLDKYTNVKDARSLYKKAFDIDELTKQGRKLFKRTDDDEFISILRKLEDEGDADRISAFIRGAGQKISQEARGKSKVGFLNELERGDTPYARMFRELFPEGKIDDVLQDIEKTNQFTGAYGKAESYQAQQGIELGKQFAPRKFSKTQIIEDVIEEFMPRALNNRQRARISDILKEELPNTIVDNLDRPEYSSVLREFIRNNMPTTVAIVTQ